jgi:hypothetical protein
MKNLFLFVIIFSLTSFGLNAQTANLLQVIDARIDATNDWFVLSSSMYWLDVRQKSMEIY